MTNFVSNGVFTLPNPQQSSATTRNFANFSIFANCIFGYILPTAVPLFAAAARTTAHTPHQLRNSPSAALRPHHKQPRKRPYAFKSPTYCLCHLLPPVSRTLLPLHFHTCVLACSKLLQSIFQIEHRTTSTYIYELNLQSRTRNQELRDNARNCMTYPTHTSSFTHLPPVLCLLT